MNWYEWFGFSSDPFISTPLRSEDEFNTLFVKTDSLKNELDYITSQMKSGSFLSLVAGNRGVGKSTTLQYASYLCQKDEFLSFYIGLVPVLDKNLEPTFELSRLLLYSIIEKLIIGIYTHKNDFFYKYKRNFIRWGRLIGLDFDEIEGFYISPSYRLDFKTLNSILSSLMSFIKQEGYPILICIDNLDKIDTNILIQYLKGGTAQAIFESMNNAGISILIASDIRLLESVDKNPDLNYLKRKIILKSLKPLDAESLISLRVQKFSSKPSNVFYEKKVVLNVCTNEKGITRNILNRVRELFIEAFNHKIKFISYDFMKLDKGHFKEREIYYKIVQDELVKNGSIKLLNLSYLISEDESEDLAKILFNIYEEKRIKIEPRIMSFLMNNEILISDLRFRPKLDNDIQRLFNKLLEDNWKIMDFIKWQYQVESIETARIQYSGIRVLSYMNKYLELLDNIIYEEPNIVVIRNGKSITFDMKEWIPDLKNRLKNILDNYNKIKSVDLEDVDTAYLNRLIYFILKDYCIFFVKYYTIYLKSPINFSSVSRKIFDWDYIFSGIRNYQNNMRYKFNTYTLITEFLRKYDATQKGLYQMSYIEIEEILFNLEQIILEFSKQTEYFFRLPNKKESVSVDIKQIQVINNTLVKLNKYFNINEYNMMTSIFNILEARQNILLENGLYTVIKNSAINIRKKIFKEKSGKYRGQYNISLLVGVNHKIFENDIYPIMEVINEIVNYIENTEEKTFLKPYYEVWMITFNDYDKLAVSLLNMIKKPIRTEIYFKTFDDINNMFISSDVTLEDKLIQDKSTQHIFVAYKEDNYLSEKTAAKVVNYLTTKNIPVWYFPSEVKLGDSMTQKEEEAIKNAFSAIICFTSDFLDGGTSRQEYNALMAKKRANPEFKVGLLLLNCDSDDVPFLMQDSYYFKISNPDDPMLSQIIESIYHGIMH